MWTVGQTVYFSRTQDIFVRCIIVAVSVVTNQQGTKVYYDVEYQDDRGMNCEYGKSSSQLYNSIEDAIGARDRETKKWEDSV